MTDPVWVTPNGGLLLKEQGRDSFKIPSGYSMGEEIEEEVSETESVEDPVIVTKSTCNPHLELRRPFRFSGHRTRIDWRALYGIDAEEVVRARHCASLLVCLLVLKHRLSCIGPDCACPLSWRFGCRGSNELNRVELCQTLSPFAVDDWVLTLRARYTCEWLPCS